MFFLCNFFRKSCAKRPHGTICGVAAPSSVKWMLRTFEAIKRSPFFNPPPTRRPFSANSAVRFFTPPLIEGRCPKDGGVKF